MYTQEIMTVAGAVGGFMKNGVHKFWGIPYAKAPVGKLRFAPPDTTVSWEGVYDATYHRFIAPQVASNLDAPMGPVLREQSEDCLTLTVTTPELSGKLPVAVWFHGGANVCGAGNLDWYDGEALAREGRMVVVNVNFRLGALGFLVHPVLNTENLSILDQIAALRWVQENIGQFGGDPAQVTLFGQSAGANAVAHMLSLPETAGLFQRVILQSPSLGRANFTQKDAAAIAETLFACLNIDSLDEERLNAEIRKKTPQEILQAVDRCTEICGSQYGGMIFKQVRDEWSTTKQTIEAAVKEAKRRQIPIVIGTTRDEMYAFHLFREGEEERRYCEIQEQRFDRPALDFVKAAASAGCQVWKYRFDWSAKDSIYSACHCLELPFVFGTFAAWQDAPMLKGTEEAEFRQLSCCMQDFWRQFITSGEIDKAAWPAFTEENPVQIVFDNMKNECRRCEVK